MTANVTVLNQALKLISDAAIDTQKVVSSTDSALVKLFSYENLVGDLMALLPQIGQIPAEVSQLLPADYTELAQTFVNDLKLTDVQAKTIIEASLKLLNDLALVVLPDVEALITAIKGAK